MGTFIFENCLPSTDAGVSKTSIKRNSLRRSNLRACSGLQGALSRTNRKKHIHTCPAKTVYPEDLPVITFLEGSFPQQVKSLKKAYV